MTNTSMIEISSEMYDTSSEMHYTYREEYRRALSGIRLLKINRYMDIDDLSSAYLRTSIVFKNFILKIIPSVTVANYINIELLNITDIRFNYFFENKEQIDYTSKICIKYNIHSPEDMVNYKINKAKKRKRKLYCNPELCYKLNSFNLYYFTSITYDFFHYLKSDFNLEKMTFYENCIGFHNAESIESYSKYFERVMDYCVKEKKKEIKKSYNVNPTKIIRKQKSPSRWVRIRKYTSAEQLSFEDMI